MANTTPCAEALFAGLAAVWTADSNKLGGGLVDTTSGVREFLRDGNAYDNLAVPYTVVSITTRPTGGFSVRREACTVRFMIHTLKNQAHAEQNAIHHQIRVKFDNVIPATLDGWEFSPLSLSDQTSQARGQPDHNVLVVSAGCFGRFTL